MSSAAEGRIYESLIGAELLAGERERLDLIDPATGEVFAGVSSATPEDVETALAVAAEASSTWAAVPVGQRADMLRRAADLIEDDSERLVDELVAEAGKPLGEARGEIGKSVATYRYYAGLAGALDGRAFNGEGGGVRHETVLEPIGPVVAISAWNVPGAGPARKIAPAVLAGDPVLVKPASATPLTAINLVAALHQAGAPAEAVQVVCGRGEPTGRVLATDPRVMAVSFTGSTRIGLDLERQLGGGLTRLQLELGGKNPALVLEDADLEAAADHVVAAAFALAGQQCTATSRVIVEESVHDRFLQLVTARSEKLVVGDTRDEGTVMGPLISARHRQDVHGFVERAVADGARIATGGEIPDGPGFFYPPTILADVDPDSEIALDEVFGPVIAVLRARDLDHAIELANQPVYGLSSAVHTASLSKARRAVAEIDAGVVSVNGPTAGIELAAPFGGFKQSGTPSKEHGPESLGFYTRMKLASWRS